MHGSSLDMFLSYPVRTPLSSDFRMFDAMEVYCIGLYFIALYFHCSPSLASRLGRRA